MDRVRLVQKGQKTRQFLRLKHIFGVAEDKSLSLIYQDQRGVERSLDIMCPNKDGFKYILTAFKKIVGMLSEEAKASETNKDKQYLRAMWNQADVDHNGTLSKEEIFKLVQYMNIHMSMELVKDMFKRVDVDDNGSLDFNEFASFMDTLRRRAEFDNLWIAAMEGNYLPKTFDEALVLPDKLTEAERRGVIGCQTFINFWNSCQGSVLTESDVEALAQKLSPDFEAVADVSTPASSAQEISHRLFVDMFCCPENDLFSAKMQLVGSHDMSQPLSHYFIDSSHATYLEGDQLMSRVTLHQYAEALRAGVRCVDIRCFDGDAQGPVVHHGHGITGKLLLADVLKTIVQIGFEKSPYPIILNLENYCTAEQQLRVVQLLKTILKKALAVPATRSDISAPLPSPAQLKGFVLLRCALLDVAGTGALDAVDDDDDDGGTSANRAKQRTKNIGVLKMRQVPVIAELAQLVYLSNTGSHGYDELKANGNAGASTDSVWTLNESKASSLVGNQVMHDRVILHHATHLGGLRPKQSRVDSSNFDPMIGWVLGSQMVALNQQTSDLFLRLYRGRFRENGSCGYVLKPEYLLSRSVLPGRARITLNILGAHQLPKPLNSTQGEIIDPYVVASIHGAPGDKARYQTKTVLDNGFNPLWNEVVVFEVSNVSLGILTLEVFDEDVTTSEFVAYSSIPLTCLATGFRNCALLDKFGRTTGDFQFASLSVRLAIDML